MTDKLNLLVAQINIILRAQTPYRTGYMASQWKYSRITSYNVCYTKLLRDDDTVSEYKK